MRLAKARHRLTTVAALAVGAALLVAAPVRSADEAAERQVRAAERAFNEARARADVATLDRLLVDAWTVTHANGTTDGKAQYLADLQSGTRQFSGSVTEDDVSVRLYGDTAIVTGSSRSTVTFNGQPQGGALHFTRVYVRQNAAWRMVVSQATQRQTDR
jgi:ketosteroid isomerase-like protein